MNDQIRIRLSEEDQEWLNGRADGCKPGEFSQKIRVLIEERRRAEKPELLRFASFLQKHQERDATYGALSAAIRAFYKQDRSKRHGNQI